MNIFVLVVVGLVGVGLGMWFARKNIENKAAETKSPQQKVKEEGKGRILAALRVACPPQEGAV